MTVKEKLVEIIENAGYLRQYPGTMARILIENGVTFATDNNDGCKWIPVAERLPEVAKNVLCFDNHGRIFIGAYLGAEYKKGLSAFRDTVRGYGRGTTHWMPLPEPPKEGVNDGK